MAVNQPGTSLRGFTSELKFVVDASVAQEILEWARERLAADPHGAGTWSDEYRVSSVYFDTDARDVFHRRASFGRSKYRIRRYEDEPTVFLERKLRTGSLLAKRRTPIEAGTLPLINGTTLNGDATAWFRRRLALRGLRPVCQVSYARVARMSDTPSGPARLTLDRGLTTFASSVFTFEDRPGVALLEGFAIVELKYRGTVPLVFKDAVETFALSARRWSKYRAAATALRLVECAPDGAPLASHA